jgi:hypothetical protein
MRVLDGILAVLETVLGPVEPLLRGGRMIVGIGKGSGGRQQHRAAEGARQQASSQCSRTHLSGLLGVVSILVSSDQPPVDNVILGAPFRLT